MTDTIFDAAVSPGPGDPQPPAPLPEPVLEPLPGTADASGSTPQPKGHA